MVSVCVAGCLLCRPKIVVFFVGPMVYSFGYQTSCLTRVAYVLFQAATERLERATRQMLAAEWSFAEEVDAFIPWETM